MDTRIQSFKDFWPYYLNEHSARYCRWVHFIGTSGFLTCLVMLSIDTWQADGSLRVFWTALLSSFIGVGSSWLEARRNTAVILLGIITLNLWIEPRLFVGVFFAYLCAWIGHFLIEKNRPATFTYPLWSLGADFKMWFEMLKGRLWT